MSLREKIIIYIPAILSGAVFIYLPFFLQNPSQVVIGYFLIFLSVIYIISYYLVPFDKISIRKIILVSTISASILFLSPAKIRNDTTAYILGAREAFLGKLNPYTTPYIQYKSDPLWNNFQNYTWAKYNYTYSPFFLLFSGLLLFISSGNFWVNVLLFRFLFLVCFLLTLYILKKLIKNQTSAIPGAIIYQL